MRIFLSLTQFIGNLNCQEDYYWLIISPLGFHKTDNNSVRCGYNADNVTERDFLRTEGDPGAAGYTIKEALALARSTVSLYHFLVPSHSKFTLFNLETIGHWFSMSFSSLCCVKGKEICVEYHRILMVLLYNANTRSQELCNTVVGIL